MKSCVILLGAPLVSAFVIPQLGFNTLQQTFQLPTEKLTYADLAPIDSESLQQLITHEDLNASAIELYKNAEASTPMMGHPTRVIGSPGHWRTLNWITKQLDDMSDYYTYTTQDFQAMDGKVFNYSIEVDKVPVSEVTALKMSPPAHVYAGDLFIVENFGCEDSDYAKLNGTVGNTVALVKRGGCVLGEKASLAGQWGAKAAIIYDPDSPEYFRGTLGVPTNTTVGALAIGNETARLLMEKRKAEPVAIDLFIASKVGMIKTTNIIAETIHGDKDNVVALGAHSDSVGTGPGINDDGSGTISLLTVAKALTNFQVNNSVRFAWWSGEEEGLFGSNFYAYNLTKKENMKIRLFMDYDMMASPNYLYMVYNGSNNVNPAGSGELRQLYIDYYESKGLDWVLTEFDGRSDYVGFIENGIPGGGILTGDDDINPANGLPCDWCYHQLCDDLTNIAWDAFLVNTQLIAHSVATYASDLTVFPARTSLESTSVSDRTGLSRRGDSFII